MKQGACAGQALSATSHGVRMLPLQLQPAAWSAMPPWPSRFHSKYGLTAKCRSLVTQLVSGLATSLAVLSRLYTHNRQKSVSHFTVVILPTKWELPKQIIACFFMLTVFHTPQGFCSTVEFVSVCPISTDLITFSAVKISMFSFIEFMPCAHEMVTSLSMGSYIMKHVHSDLAVPWTTYSK